MSFPSWSSDHWAFSTVLSLDRLEPGLAGDLLRAKPTRRQLACAILAQRDLASMPIGDKAKLARELRYAKPAALVESRFGANPPRFVECLGKLRDQYQGEAFYPGLHRLYRDPKGGAARRRLNAKRVYDGEFGTFVPSGLVELQRLGEAFMAAPIVARIGNPWMIGEVAAILRFLRRRLPHADDRHLAAILCSLDAERSIERAVARFVPKGASSPREALAAHPRIELITTPSELRQAAREFRNCLDDRKYERLLTRRGALFCVWRGEEKAVMRLARHGGLWRLWELSGPRNTCVSRPTHQAIAQILEPLGILAQAFACDGSL